MSTLNSFITIQAKSSGQDDLGQPNGSWSTHTQVWGHIRHLTGVEHVKVGAQRSDVKASIRIRKRSDITSRMRVVHGSRTYEVEAVLPDETSRHWMFLVCKVSE